MFLDDMLLKECRAFLNEPTTPEKIQELNVTLCEMCKNYYKDKISIGMPKKVVRVILNKTFNLWDSFVRMALNDDDVSMVIIGKLFSEYTFKKQFLGNQDANNFYESLK